MKTNDVLLAIATAAFSYLFYDQNAGINFLIFTVLFIAVIVYRDRTVLQNKKWLWSAVMCLIASTGILLHSSALAVIANIFSLLLLSAFSFNRKTSAAFSFAFSMYSLAISALVILDRILRPTPKENSVKRGEGAMYALLGVVAVLLLSAMFLAFYRAANPLFEANTAWLNLQFLSFSWIVFTLFGFIIVHGLLNHRPILVVENWENNLPSFNFIEPQSSVKLTTERVSGVVLFVLLNIMLLILNMGDVGTLFFGHSLPEGISHSDFVHNTVEVIIISIIFASGLIMLLFRKDFRKQSNNGLLKFLVCFWIIQTLVMLMSAAIRNQMYIQEFSLTHLRIGVYVWLALAAIGLALTAEKVLREKSNWYLVRTNVAVWFSILSLASLLNWDLMIARYNMSQKPLTQIDFKYLFELADSAIPELIAVTKHKDFQQLENKIRIDSTFKNMTYHQKLHRKINGYIREYKDDWQSWDLTDTRITGAIIRR